MTDPWTPQLSEYMDGELSADEQRRLEVHLATCADCTSVLAGLREVAAAARTLPLQRPPVDLWPGIEARIGVRASSMGAPVTAKRAATRRGLLDWLDRRFTITVPQAAAAMAALMAVAGTGVWLLMARGPAHSTTAPVTMISSVTPAPASGNTTPTGTAAVPTGPGGAMPVTSREPLAANATTASTAGIDRRYDATIAELQRVLAEERSRLDPKTVQVLETNLAIIDRAVADARRAVEADPANFYLRNHLASVMKRKADLLRQATLLAQEQGSEG